MKKKGNKPAQIANNTSTTACIDTRVEEISEKEFGKIIVKMYKNRCKK